MLRRVAQVTHEDGTVSDDIMHNPPDEIHEGDVFDIGLQRHTVRVNGKSHILIGSIPRDCQIWSIQCQLNDQGFFELDPLIYDLAVSTMTDFDNQEGLLGDVKNTPRDELLSLVQEGRYINWQQVSCLHLFYDTVLALLPKNVFKHWMMRQLLYIALNEATELSKDDYVEVALKHFNRAEAIITKISHHNRVIAESLNLPVERIQSKNILA